MTAFDRLFGWQQAFDDPATVVLVCIAGGLLLASGATIRLLRSRVSERLAGELRLRFRSWLVLASVFAVAILPGAAFVLAGTTLLALLCFREFARATGLFREPSICLVVLLGILAAMLAAANHWYDFFVALPPLVLGALAAIALLQDQPRGYIQRVALGTFAFLLFGVCLGHLAYFANDAHYRALLIWLLICVELNDVLGFVVGKTLGRRRFMPNTSPNKTAAGAIGSLLLTVLIAAALGSIVFRGTPMEHPVHLATIGLIIGITGQVGDLLLSSIKRDLGIKDMAATIPGHGGMLDRFDSLLLAAPASFHYIHYFRGIGLDQQTHIFFG